MKYDTLKKSYDDKVKQLAQFEKMNPDQLTRCQRVLFM